VTEILVCVLCRPHGVSRDQPRAGRALFEAIEVAALENNAPFHIRPVDCMSGCTRACTVALQSPGKLTYFFGDLSPQAESAQQVLACAQLHDASPDGLLERAQRPSRMREGILARLPPTLPTSRRDHVQKPTVPSKVFP